MNEKNNFELNLSKLCLILWKRLPIILLVSVLTAVVAFFSSRTPVVTTYVGKASFLVPKEYSVTERQVEYSDPQDYSDTSSSVTVFSASSVDTYCFVAVAPTTLELVASRANLPYSPEELSQMVSASQEKSNTYTFAVVVKCSDKDEALRIAQAFADVLPGFFSEISPEPPLRVLNPGSVSSQTSGGTDTKKAGTYAATSALAITCFFILLYFIKEFSGKNLVLSSDLKGFSPKVRILSVFSSTCDAEAVKRLRSNLLIALPDSDGCRIIGLTAAHPESAKDDLALALTRSLSSLGDRTLLIDADLRTHRLQDLLGLDTCIGYSELIHRDETEIPSLQEIKEDRSLFSFLPSGDGASEASELLDSRKICPLLNRLKEEYDYILLNLEALGTSVDAASVGKELDGVIVVLREEGCSLNQFAACVSQLEFAEAPVLGFVLFKRNKMFRKLFKK